MLFFLRNYIKLYHSKHTFSTPLKHTAFKGLTLSVTAIVQRVFTKQYPHLKCKQSLHAMNCLRLLSANFSVHELK